MPPMLINARATLSHPEPQVVPDMARKVGSGAGLKNSQASANTQLFNHAAQDIQVVSVWTYQENHVRSGALI